MAEFFGRCWRLATLGLFALALSAPAASAGLLDGLAGGNCQNGGSQVFAPWKDYKAYYLAPNGGLENGSSGWSLSGGASVVGGNQPFFGSGSHSLSLPSGSTAMSPVTCIGPKQPSIRMFGSDRGGTDGGLRVRVVWYGLLNKVLGITDYGTFTPGGEWYPTSSVSSTGGFNLLLPLLGSTSARVLLTPIGSDSAWRIDDVYVDPWWSGE
ncbi:MAG: hypothetical protein WAQ33_10105 [Gaiellaceae bacterium]